MKFKKHKAYIVKDIVFKVTRIDGKNRIYIKKLKYLGDNPTFKGKRTSFIINKRSTYWDESVALPKLGQVLFGDL